MNTTAQIRNKPLSEYLGAFAVPLEIGNVWNFRNANFQPEFRVELFDTVFINGHKYYSLKRQDIEGYIYKNEYLRLREDGYFVCFDSLYSFFPQQDYIFYKLNASKGDSWTQQDMTNKNYYHNIIDSIEISSFWGTYLLVKIVEVTDSVLTTYWEYWSDEFGMIQQQTEEFGAGGWYYLWGCYINGQQYGDTVLVSVDEANRKYLTDFKLHQNYPNPFNSNTIINYEVAKSAFVSIIVYDALGNMIKQLVSDTKAPGKYQVTFDVNSFNRKLSTGVYFYKIFLDQKQQTRKMIYLK
jgi:hypothetical protein